MVMAYIGMAYIVMAYIVMAYILMAYILMALYTYGPYSYGLYLMPQRCASPETGTGMCADVCDAWLNLRTCTQSMQV